MNCCINIDWLELFCYESYRLFPMDADFFEQHGFRVLRRDYGTRVYKEMFTLLDEHDYPFIEIRRCPASDKANDGGLFDEKSTHIRLSNYYCYHNDPIGLVREFLSRFDYTLVRIFRIDICCDFEKFIHNQDPQIFIKRYMDGRYSKVNQTNISAHGVDRWDGRTWQSLSWGKPKSMIGTKLYCKTLELAQVKDKPYIRQAWWLAGLVDSPTSMTKRDKDERIYKPDIWRVEFSIHSSAKKWYLIERSDTRKEHVQPMPHTLDIYDSRYKLEVVFASLARHYFRFKIFEEGKRKDRCRDKELFDHVYITHYYKVDRLASHTPQTSKLTRLLLLLENYAETTIEETTRKAVQVIVESIKKRQQVEFAGSHFSPEDILILQRLIAERMQGKRETDISKAKQAISDIVQDFVGDFF